MSDKKCEGCGKPATGTDLDDVPLCDACGRAEELPPPAPGPAFDAEFLSAVDAVLAEQKAMTGVLGPCETTLGQLLDRLRGLRAALAPGAAVQNT